MDGIHVIETVDHRVGTLGWRVRPKHAVVDRQDVAAVRVRLGELARMVDLVHVRRHPHERQHTIDRCPEPDIGVLDDSVAGLQQLDHYRGGWDSKDPHGDDCKRNLQTVSTGCVRYLVVTSTKSSLWCTRWNRHIAGHMCMIRCAR